MIERSCLDNAPIGGHGVRLRYEREQLIRAGVAVEAQLGQIVQEEVELREPRPERILDHACEHGRRLGIRFVRQQGSLHVTNGVRIDALYVGRGH